MRILELTSIVLKKEEGRLKTLNAPGKTVANGIPLGRRIREIMKEKGAAFTNTALAIRMGSSRDTIRRMLMDERELFKYELEKISEALGESVSRILQEDVSELVNEIESLLARTFDLHQGVELAEKFFHLSIGATERCKANIYMGKVFFQSRRYEMAHPYRVEAHRLATEIKDTYGESELFDMTTIDLITSFTVRKDYANAHVLLDVAQKVLNDNPKRLGAIQYSLAMIAYNAGRHEEARDQLYGSLESFKRTLDEREIGQALHNVAFIEFELRNFDTAKELFEQAIQTLAEFEKVQLISLKDYARLHHNIGDRQHAIQLIEQALAQADKLSTPPDLHSKLLLLHSIYTGSKEGALNVLDLPDAGDQMKFYACQYLMDYYCRKGDSLLLMEYYKRADAFLLNNTSKFGEGCL